MSATDNRCGLACVPHPLPRVHLAYTVLCCHNAACRALHVAGRLRCSTLAPWRPALPPRTCSKYVKAWLTVGQMWAGSPNVRPRPLSPSCSRAEGRWLQLFFSRGVSLHPPPSKQTVSQRTLFGMTKCQPCKRFCAACDDLSMTHTARRPFRARKVVPATVRYERAEPSRGEECDCYYSRYHRESVGAHNGATSSQAAKHGEYSLGALASGKLLARVHDAAPVRV